MCAKVCSSALQAVESPGQKIWQTPSDRSTGAHLHFRRGSISDKLQQVTGKGGILVV
jgi:hypothetical protein